MTDEPKRERQSAEIVALKSDELPVIPKLDRVAVARKKISRADWRNRSFQDINALAAEFEDCDFGTQILRERTSGTLVSPAVVLMARDSSTATSKTPHSTNAT